MPKRNAKSDNMHKKSLTWIARVMEERDGERVRLLRRPRTPTKLEWERHVVSQMPFRDCCSHCVAGRGLERRHQHPGHDDQYPLVCIVGGHLSLDVTPMLVVQDRRTGMVFALPVERKGAADPHAGEKLAEWVVVLRSTQVTMRSDGDPAVMHVAATVRGGRRELSVTTLETSAPSDHGRNGLAERAVRQLGGMERTLKNELEFNSSIEDRCLDNWARHQDAEPGHGWSDGKWRGPGHHMGIVFGERVWYRVRPLTDRTKAEDRKESGMTVEESVHETVRLRRMREGTRAQGHSAVCRERMEELLPRTAKSQQRLDEAERRTRETAVERAAKRIKLQVADSPVNPASSRSANPASSSSASPSDAIAGACRSRCWQRVCRGMSLKMRLKTELEGAEAVPVTMYMTKKRAKRQRTEKKTEQEMEVSYVAKVKDSRRILDLRRDGWEPESW